MLSYTFAPGAAVKGMAHADAQKIGERLEELRLTHGGRLRSEHAVEDARPPGSLLHQHFDWSDSIAGPKWRLHQARRLITSIRVIEVDDGSVGVPNLAFVSLNADDGEGRNYIDARSIVDSGFLQAKLLEAGYKDLVKWINRFGHLENISPDVAELAERLRQELAARLV